MGELHDMAGSLASEPSLRRDVLFGARAPASSLTLAQLGASSG